LIASTRDDVLRGDGDGGTEMTDAGRIVSGPARPPDIEHQQFIGLIDELRLMILNRDDFVAIEETFDELDEVAVSEFAREEEAMRTNGLPDRLAHQRRHAELSHHLRSLRSQFAAAPDMPQRDQLYDFLSDLLVHTLCED
jgi:hemerythrin-like metal-binding protein